MKTAPKKPKGKTLLKKTSGDYTDAGSFLLGRDFIGGLPSKEEDAFYQYLKGKGFGRSEAGNMNYIQINGLYKRFKGTMN